MFCEPVKSTLFLHFTLTLVQEFLTEDLTNFKQGKGDTNIFCACSASPTHYSGYLVSDPAGIGSFLDQPLSKGRGYGDI